MRIYVCQSWWCWLLSLMKRFLPGLTANMRNFRMSRHSVAFVTPLLALEFHHIQMYEMHIAHLFMIKGPPYRPNCFLIIEITENHKQGEYLVSPPSTMRTCARPCIRWLLLVFFIFALRLVDKIRVWYKIQHTINPSGCKKKEQQQENWMEMPENNLRSRFTFLVERTAP